MLYKLSAKIIGVLIFGLLVLLFYIPLASAQSLKAELTAPPGKIAPRNITVEQLHALYTDEDHRYRLTIQGDNLDEKPTGESAVFTWKTNCGRFYEGGKGPASRYLSNGNRTVIWGYTYPEENCIEAEIQVTVHGFDGSDRQDEVVLAQKVFHPEIRPTILNQFYRDTAPHNTPTFRQKVNVFIGSLWHRLKLLFGSPPDDPTDTEVPGGTTGPRG